MKSPWQIGLLVLAVSGVSAYDLLYFTHFRPNNQASTQAAAPPSLIAPAEPINSTQTEPAQSGNSTGTADAASLPRISREEVNRLAHQAFVSKEDWETETKMAWPKRDPFSASGEFAPESRSVPANVVVVPSAKQASAPPSLASPQCVFSGIFIEQGLKLALVDGVPLSIGDRLGVWQLARIEPDYIILEAGKETYRIEIKSSDSEILRQKDSS